MSESPHPQPSGLDPTVLGAPAPHATYGKFNVLSLLGRGGMGVVYLAQEAGLGRRVALKVLPAAADPVAVERFRREAQAVAGLSHPGIAQMHAFGEDGGTLYYAMEYVDGKPLRKAMDTERLDWVRSARIVREAAEAIAHAHERGVVHRDLKPANILLDREGRVKIVDFGLARIRADRSLTVTGELLGTPHYMSPEQADGSPDVGPATDIYALGVTLFEMAALRLPFEETDPARLIVQIAMDEPPTPSSLRAGVPRDLETVVMKCLEKDPAARYPSARELADDLGRFAAGEPVRARPIGPAVRLWRRLRRWRATLAAVAAVLLLAAAVLGLQARAAARKAEAFRARQDAADILATVERRAMAARRDYFEFGGPLDGYRHEMSECAAASAAAAGRDPKWSAPVSGAGTYWRAAGESRRARAAFQQALLLDPDDPAALLGLAEMRIEEATIFMMGLAIGGAAESYGQGLVVQARAGLARLKAAGRAESGLLPRADALERVVDIVLASPEERRGRAAAVAAELEEAAAHSRSPGLMWIYASIVHKHRIVGVGEEAGACREAMLRCAGTATGIMPRSAWAKLFYGNAVEAAGRRAEALPIYEQAAREDPLLVAALISRATARYHTAKERLEDPTASADRSQLWREWEGVIPEVEADITRALELDPSPLFLATRAEVRWIHAFHQISYVQRWEPRVWEGVFQDYDEFQREFPGARQLNDHVGGAHYWAAVGADRHGAGDLAGRAPYIRRHLDESVGSFERASEGSGSSGKFLGYILRSRMLRLDVDRRCGAVDDAGRRRELESLLAAADAAVAAEVRENEGYAHAIVPILRARILAQLDRHDEAIGYLEEVLKSGTQPEIVNLVPGALEQLRAQRPK